MNVRLAKSVDRFIGGFLCVILCPFALLKRKPKKVKSILLIRLWAIGESILTLPMIAALKKKYPDVKIDVLVTKRSADVFTLNKDVNKVRYLSITTFFGICRYDYVFDAEPFTNISALAGFFIGKWVIGFSHGKRALLYNSKVEFNDKQHEVHTFMELLGEIGIHERPEKLPRINVGGEDRKVVKDLLIEKGIPLERFIVGIAPGVAESAKSRMWPYKRFAKLADLLSKERYCTIIFVGSGKDRRIVRKIQENMESKSFDLTGLTLKETIYLIENCNLFISNDSGPMHIAAAQGVKTIGLFGPNLPVRFKPFGKHNNWISKKAECSPCINVHKGLIPECKFTGKEYQKCMKAIRVNDVFLLAKKMMRE